MIHNAHQDAITSCCWSDVGNYVITGSNDATLKLWDTKFLIANMQNREKLKEKHQFVGHNTSVIDLKYRVSNYLFGSSKSSSYNFFTPRKKVIKHTLQQEEMFVSISMKFIACYALSCY